MTLVPLNPRIKILLLNKSPSSGRRFLKILTQNAKCNKLPSNYTLSRFCCENYFQRLYPQFRPFIDPLYEVYFLISPQTPQFSRSPRLLGPGRFFCLRVDRGDQSFKNCITKGKGSARCTFSYGPQL